MKVFMAGQKRRGFFVSHARTTHVYNHTKHYTVAITLGMNWAIVLNSIGVPLIGALGTTLDSLHININRPKIYKTYIKIMHYDYVLYWRSLHCLL